MEIWEKEMEDEQMILSEQITKIKDKAFSIQSSLALQVLMWYLTEGDKEIRAAIESQIEDEKELNDFQLVEADEFNNDEYREYERKSNEQ